PLLDALLLSDCLAPLGLEVVLASGLTRADAREPLFAADVGISGVDYLIAETGSVVGQTKPEEPRSLRLLPPVHIAVADRSQLLPDLFDLIAVLPGGGKEGPGMPSCVALITGPSKTDDIELRLVTGVHGPGDIHVILISA